MITATPITLPFLGRRYKAFCHRCQINLPGHHTDKTEAIKAGNTHAERWHGGHA